jgi:hypothetical protein
MRTPGSSVKTLGHGNRDWARLDGPMVTARELTQTLRVRSAERRAKAEVRAERLRAQLPSLLERIQEEGPVL